MRRKEKLLKVRVTEDQYEFLEEFSKAYGITKSEMVRKLIDAFLILSRMPVLKALKSLPELAKELVEEEENAGPEIPKSSKKLR